MTTPPGITTPSGTPTSTARAARRWPLWTSAGVLALTAAVHIVAGTPEMMDPLLTSSIDPIPQQTLRVVWHVTSVVLVTLPIALGLAARVLRTEPAAARALIGYVWVLCLAFVVGFLAVDVDAFGTAVFTLPQWVLFVPPVALLPLASGRRASR